MTQDKRPVTLITGASAGIGAALAREFAANGHELLLVARREPALVALADAIAEKGAGPTILSADVARTGAAQEIAEALERHGLEPEVIVNNAGAGLTGAADKLDRAEQLAVIDLNVRALTDLSLAFVDSLKRRRGGILNVASLAAFMPGSRTGGLLRQQGLRAFVQRGAASRAQAARRARDGALPRPGADRVAGARGHDRFPAAAVHALRRGGCARSLSRSEPRPPHGRSGLCQSRGDDGDSPLPAQPLARADRAAAAARAAISAAGVLKLAKSTAQRVPSLAGLPFYATCRNEGAARSRLDPRQ